jgi:gp16 family phage-associated protein
MQFDQIHEADLAAVRRRFWLEGETIADWAAKNGFSPATTYSLLAGRLRARRGEAHRIAVALGLKPPSAGTDALKPAGKGGTVEK